MKNPKISFSEKFLIIQTIWISFLFMAHVLSQSYSLLVSSTNKSGIGSFAILNLDNEGNLPAWYSACALFLCAVLAGVIAYSKWRQPRGSRYKWAGLGVVFAFLSLDESASLHEGLIPGLLRKLEFGIVAGEKFDWTPLGMAAFAIVFLVYFRFWLKLPSKTRSLFAISALVFLAGAVGFEKISHFYEALHETENTIAYILTCGIEELLEMLGVALFNYALLSYIFENIGFIQTDTLARERALAEEMATQ